MGGNGNGGHGDDERSALDRVEERLAAVADDVAPEATDDTASAMPRWEIPSDDTVEELRRLREGLMIAVELGQAAIQQGFHTSRQIAELKRASEKLFGALGTLVDQMSIVASKGAVAGESVDKLELDLLARLGEQDGKLDQILSRLPLPPPVPQDLAKDDPLDSLPASETEGDEQH